MALGKNKSGGLTSSGILASTIFLLPAANNYSRQLNVSDSLDKSIITR
jgi:hypothetical protein